MRTSIIIPTYNGAHKILNLLSGLEQQSTMPDEVIVVVDGSTDGTADLLRKTNFKFHNFNLIEQGNGGRAKVRNRGAEVAKGDLFIFIDDDMQVPSDWLAQHIIHHELNKGSIATGRLKDPYEKDGDDFQKFKSWLNNKWNENLPQEDNQTAILLDYPYITANNFSIPKAIFEELKGFDGRLTDAEDYDMAKRAMLLNIPLYINHQAIAWHYDHVNCLKYVQRQRQYTIAQNKLEQLKPELYNNDHQYKITRPTGIKGYIFNILSTKWWVSSVDKGTWKWLPEALRYKLYDMIITANGSFFPEKAIL
jgi:glycosyltransferase involved in cell wall biosynthesis